MSLLEQRADAILRDIQSLTDAAMSRLNDEDFLEELLDRVKDILHVDVAAMLLLEGTELLVTAAAGLQEETRQGVRIPVGKGFAGRIALERRPIILDHVDHTTAVSPILTSKGIRSMLGVPLMADGTLIGVIHVGSVTARDFTADDVNILQLAADRAAATVASFRIRADRLAAAALQRSLLPAALPVMAGVEAAARYLPGNGVIGGDWYDVFTLPCGHLGVVIGDVAGSGLPAAIIMGRMRSALRAYALESHDPAEVLAKLDRKMQFFEPGALATVLYAIIDIARDSATISSAGHLPPVVATEGQPAEIAEVEPDLMIGVAADAERHITTIKMMPGTLLCLYTDGLVESPGQPIDHGLAQLRRAVGAQSPEEACAAVIGTLVGDAPVRDDVALLMLRREPTPLDA